MSDKSALDSIMDKYGKTVDIFDRNACRAYVTVEPKDVPSVCRYMYEGLGGRLATVSGVDTRSGIEILYHFMYPRDHKMITVRTKVKKPSPEIESIGVFLPAAIWIEREIFDLLGVIFKNHPDPRRLVLSDNWPEDVHPLRRDFKEPDR